MLPVFFIENINHSTEGVFSFAPMFCDIMSVVDGQALIGRQGQDTDWSLKFTQKQLIARMRDAILNTISTEKKKNTENSSVEGEASAENPKKEKSTREKTYDEKKWLSAFDLNRRLRRGLWSYRDRCCPENGWRIRQ